MINFYEKRIDELETENEKLNDTIYDLEGQLENQKRVYKQKLHSLYISLYLK